MVNRSSVLSSYHETKLFEQNHQSGLNTAESKSYKWLELTFFIRLATIKSYVIFQLEAMPDK